MGTVDKLAERYTYNGQVSLKAVDDDIAVLENRIKDYEEKLRVARERGKSREVMLPMAMRMGELRIGLSRLKAFRNSEFSRTVSDDGAMSGAIGVSALVAEGVDFPGTAAAGREPARRDFASSGAEGAQPGCFEGAGTVAGEVVNESRETPAEAAAEGFPEPYELAVPPLTETEGDLPRTAAVPTAVDSNTVVANHLLTADDYVFSLTHDKGLVVDMSHPLTIDDYVRSLSRDTETVTIDTSGTDTGPDIGGLTLPETDETGAGDGHASGFEPVPETADTPVPEMFAGPETRARASFDLHDMTGAVNTDSVRGHWSRGILCVEFSDIRDYPVFLKIVNDYHKGGFLRRLLKKRGSIFMTVYIESEGETRRVEYEFTGCSPAGFSETGFDTARDTVYPGWHNKCWVDFKYKRLKIKQ